ncbi:hypothetical protein ACWEF9_01215 [Streptomyces sp. NPDC004980]
MSPLPGAPRGNAPPRGRPDTPAHQLRHALAALLLTVLTLVGGASAASGAAVPLHTLTGTAPAAPVTGNAPGAQTPAPQAPTPRTDRTLRAGHARDHRPVRAAETSGPSAAGARSAVATAPGRQAEAAPAPAPRAGADRTLAPQHFPPPGHGALPPGLPGLPVLRAVAQEAARAALFVPGRIRAALPGVRGPPRVTAGQPATHRSCSTDPSSRSL